MGAPGDLATFTDQRAHLLGVAYRLTGSWADAEDAVQDAWLRWDRLDAGDRAAVREPRAWLTTTVARLCLDRVRSAPARREQYVGPWLPEPLVASGPDDVLDAVVAGHEVRMAAMLVLERLSPDQRVALVLHDATGVDFAAIGEVLGCPAATARQHASRARRIVAAAAAEGALPEAAPATEQRRVLDAFVTALATGDVPALVGVLHPGAVLRSDGGGVVRAARRPVLGADKVARLLVALGEQAGAEALATVRPVQVNGEAGLLLPGPAPIVLTLTVADGRAVAVHLPMNPERLRVP